MRAFELEESAVEELKDRLPKLKRHNYDTIDRLMQHVCSKHKITGKKLHDMFVSKYGHTPDTWIKKYKNKLGEEDVAEAGHGRNRGYTPGFASPHAPELGGRRHREDDEGWDREEREQTQNWYIRINGKLLKDKQHQPYTFRGKEAARKAALTMMSKDFNKGKKFTLTTSWMDAPEQGVAEGFFGIEDKIKGEIQNIVSDLSDISGMWDHKAQTFTPAGLEKLKSVLKNNPKYIKYAVNLTADDYEAEGVAEGHADQQRKIFKKDGKPVGEVGIDRESSPGVGQWYMTCYGVVSYGGYDSYEEAVEELKHCLKQGVTEGEVLPLKRPMNKVQHGKRTFPPTQRDVKEPEGNVTPLPQKKSNVNEGVEGPEDMQKIKDFVKWSYKTLNMQKPYPRITLSKDTKAAQAGHHTGLHKGNDIWVYVANRNLIDIFRTLFHELTHHRQMQLGMIKDGDSYPGSPIEMLADMAAGKYIKVYGKDHPEMFQ